MHFNHYKNNLKRNASDERGECDRCFVICSLLLLFQDHAASNDYVWFR